MVGAVTAVVLFLFLIDVVVMVVVVVILTLVVVVYPHDLHPPSPSLSLVSTDKPIVTIAIAPLPTLSFHPDSLFSSGHCHHIQHNTLHKTHSRG